MEIQKKMDELGRAFEEFKKINDQRLDEIKAKGQAGAISEEKLAKANADVTRLQGEVDALKAAFNRSGVDHKEEKSTGDSKEYKTAFERFMRKGAEIPESAIPAELKALSVDSNADGGFLVRPELSSEIVKKIWETSPIRQLASVETIGSDSLDILVDYDETDAGWVAERGSRIVTQNAKLNMKKIFAHEMYAEPSATQKLLDDSFFNVEAWLSEKVADKMARKEATAFVSGNGVGQPMGFLSYGDGTAYGQIQQVKSGSNGAFAGDGLMDLLYALKEAYQKNATFLTQRVNVGAIRKLKDSYGRYLWEPSLALGQPESLLGKPIMFAADMPNVGTGALAIACGDFKAGYKIVDRVGVRVLRDPFTSKPNVLFYTTKRVGGDVVNFEAIKVGKLSA